MSRATAAGKRKSTGLGDRRKAMLEDIAIITGGKLITEDLGIKLETGIIDPTKVTRMALQNDASIAGLMITTECLIADKPEEDKKMDDMPDCDVRRSEVFIPVSFTVIRHVG